MTAASTCWTRRDSLVWQATYHIALGLASIMVSGPLAGIVMAQEARSADEQSCAKAATIVRAFDQAIVRSGSLASEGPGKLEERSYAVARLLGCGAIGGHAGAESIRTTRHLTDRDAIVALTSPYRTFRDTAVIAAAVEVATDATATPVARIVALRTMWLVQTGKAWYGIEEMYPPRTRAPDAHPTARCGEGVQTDHTAPRWEHGAEPPAGFEAALQAVAKRLRADATQPPEIRAAALCVLLP